jgi:hypothetical protein
MWPFKNRKPKPAAPPSGMHLERGLPEIVLSSGRSISAEKIYITRTYAGLLEGRPNERSNRFHLNGIPDNMTRLFGKWPVYIVPPQFRTEPGDSGDPLFPKVSWMPEMELAASFVGDGITADSVLSILTIVWHQESLAPLMCDAVRAHLVTLPWEKLAAEFSY